MMNLKFYKMHFSKVLFTLVFSMTFSALTFGQTPRSVIHKVEVLEINQVSSYTYLRVIENDKEKWLAVPTIETEVGDMLFYKGGTEMLNFRSKELDKTFSSVLFLEKATKNKGDLKDRTFQLSGSDLHQGNTKKKVEKLKSIIAPAEGGISIAELMENKKLYDGKIVKIKGQVMKFNSKILGKNWVHLQDGTAFNGLFDLTLTTNAVVQLEEVVVLEGKVTLDKDFGYGYFYELIIEDAQLIED